MPADYICNLLLPGAAKSGTSSLHNYLNLHPEVSMSSVKEPHHFCVEEQYLKGPNHHNQLFETGKQSKWFGESSTGYLPSKKAASRIRSELEGPKAIILLRHPVERTFSHYRWRYRLGLEKRNLIKAVSVDGFGFNPDQVKSYGYMAYLEFSQYSAQVPRWEDNLGKTNCLVIASEDLKTKRKKTIDRCFTFLGVRPIDLPNLEAESNSTDSLQRRTPKPLSMAAKAIPNAIKQGRFMQQVKQDLLRVTTPRPQSNMSKAERDYLEAALSEDIRWYEDRFTSNSPSQQNAGPGPN